MYVDRTEERLRLMSMWFGMFVQHCHAVEGQRSYGNKGDAKGHRTWMIKILLDCRQVRGLLDILCVDPMLSNTRTLRDKCRNMYDML